MRWLIAAALIGFTLMTNMSMETSPSLPPEALEAAKAQRVRETQACMAQADPDLAAHMKATRTDQVCDACAALLAGHKGPPLHDLRDQYTAAEARAERARISVLRNEIARREPLVAAAFAQRPQRAPWAFDMDESLIDDAAGYYCDTLDSTPLAPAAPFS